MPEQGGWNLSLSEGGRWHQGPAKETSRRVRRIITEDKPLVAGAFAV